MSVLAWVRLPANGTARMVHVLTRPERGGLEDGRPHNSIRAKPQPSESL